MRTALTVSLLAAATLAACVPVLPESEPVQVVDSGAPVSGKGGSGGGGAGDASVPSGPFTLVASAGRPRNLAFDGNVYWVNRDTLTLMSIPEDGRAAPSQRARVKSTDAWVAAYNGYLYWSDGANGAATNIYVLPAGGTQPTLIVSGTDAISQIAVSSAGEGVFWVTRGGAVMRLASLDGTPAMLASGLGSGGALAVDAGSVYWTGGDSVIKIGIAGGGAAVFASPAAGTSIAVDATNLYWVNPMWTHVLSLDGLTPDGPIMKVGLDGKNARMAFNYGYSIRGTCLATGGARVYYGDAGGTAHIVSPADGFEWTFGPMGAPAMSIVVGASSVFWSVDAPVDSIVGAPR
ncbi:MAG TPA: hypothetical protein VIF57_32170 [Polyangia bacterium]|jgi:hypothetical protein